MLANGKILVPDPTFVLPTILACECISTSSPISTLDPIIEYGPILAVREILAFLSIILVL